MCRARLESTTPTSDFGMNLPRSQNVEQQTVFQLLPDSSWVRNGCAISCRTLVLFDTVVMRSIMGVKNVPTNAAQGIVWQFRF